MVVIAAVCECFFLFFRAEAAFTKRVMDMLFL